MATQQFSIFDSLERALSTTQDFLLEIPGETKEKLIILIETLVNGAHRGSEVQNKANSLLVNKAEKYKRKYKRLRSAVKVMRSEIEIFKTHLEEGKKLWEEQIRKIQGDLEEQERSKSKIQAQFKDRLNEIDKELDEILFSHKKQEACEMGDILPQLFSPEELQQEHNTALGDRALLKLDLGKLNVQGSLDINSETPSLSINSSDFSASKLDIFHKIIEIRKKLRKFRQSESTSFSDARSSTFYDIKSLTDGCAHHSFPQYTPHTPSQELLSEFSGLLFRPQPTSPKETLILDLLDDSTLLTGKFFQDSLSSAQPPEEFSFEVPSEIPIIDPSPIHIPHIEEDPSHKYRLPDQSNFITVKGSSLFFTPDYDNHPQRVPSQAPEHALLSRPKDPVQFVTLTEEQNENQISMRSKLPLPPTPGRFVRKIRGNSVQPGTSPPRWPHEPEAKSMSPANPRPKMRRRKENRNAIVIRSVYRAGRSIII